MELGDPPGCGPGGGPGSHPGGGSAGRPPVAPRFHPARPRAGRRGPTPPAALVPCGVRWDRVPEGPGVVSADPIGEAFGSVGETGVLLELRGGSMPVTDVERRLRDIAPVAGWSYQLPSWNVWRLALPAAAWAASREAFHVLVRQLRDAGGDGACLREGSESGVQGAAQDLLRPGGCPSTEVRELERAVVEAMTGVRA